MRPGTIDSDDAASRRRQIAAYYDYTTPFYRLFWHGPTDAIHYGFRDAWTRGSGDELLNTNRFMARVAAVDYSTDVLDVGCGVGGSALWLAQTLGAPVVGVTLSASQARRARVSAERRGLAQRARFVVGDYLAAPFPGGSFDVVWALESACYAKDKTAFLCESLRLLRKGGRIVVGDGFLLREPRTAHEAHRYEEFKRGLVLPELASLERFVETLCGIGFADVRTWNQTEAALPSARRLFRRCLPALPISLLAERLRVVPRLLTENLRAGIAQYGLVRSGLLGYVVVRGARRA